MEALATNPEEERWASWRDFARRNQLLLQLGGPPKEPGYGETDEFPEAFRLLFDGREAGILHTLEQEAEFKATLVAVAGERYRLKTGRFPTSWSDLHPDYIPENVIDPFADRPMMMRSLPDAWVVYSLGPNEHDDGGERLSTYYAWWYRPDYRQWKGENLGIRVMSPGQRQQPPAPLTSEQIKALQSWNPSGAK